MSIGRGRLPEPEALAGSVAAGARGAVAEALNLLDDQRPQARQQAARFLALLPEEEVPPIETDLVDVGSLG